MTEAQMLRSAIDDLLGGRCTVMQFRERYKTIPNENPAPPTFINRNSPRDPSLMNVLIKEYLKSSFPYSDPLTGREVKTVAEIHDLSDLEKIATMEECMDMIIPSELTSRHIFCEDYKFLRRFDYPVDPLLINTFKAIILSRLVEGLMLNTVKHKLGTVKIDFYWHGSSVKFSNEPMVDKNLRVMMYLYGLDLSREDEFEKTFVVMKKYLKQELCNFKRDLAK